MLVDLILSLLYRHGLDLIHRWDCLGREPITLLHFWLSEPRRELLLKLRQLPLWLLRWEVVCVVILRTPVSLSDLIGLKAKVSSRRLYINTHRVAFLVLDSTLILETLAEVTDVQALNRRAIDIFLSPSIAEDWPSSLHEIVLNLMAAIFGKLSGIVGADRLPMGGAQVGVAWIVL